MNKRTIISNISSFTPEMKRVFNTLCDNKIYDDSDATITAAEEVIVETTGTALDALTQVQIDDDISPGLPSAVKLSRRPC